MLYSNLCLFLFKKVKSKKKCNSKLKNYQSEDDEEYSQPRNPTDSMTQNKSGENCCEDYGRSAQHEVAGMKNHDRSESRKGTL